MKQLTYPCFVYVVCSGEAVKVGKANDVYERIDGLQCGNPVRLKLLHVLPGDYKLETRLLRWLRPDRIHGEWFDGPLVSVALDAVAELADKLVLVYEYDGVAPSWRGKINWPAAAQNVLGDKPKRKPAEVTVRHVDPASLRA